MIILQTFRRRPSITCANGDTLGWPVTPSELALRDIRFAMRGDLIWDRSMPPGV